MMKMNLLRRSRRVAFAMLFILAFLFSLFTFYSNSLINVNAKTINYYASLKSELIKQGYKARVYVISGKRLKFFNSILAQYGNAVSDSHHLNGEAIDILVLDVNSDGESNSLDVDIVYNILDKLVIIDNGGIGTYKTQSGFLTQQMVHFDCRGYKARWNK